MERREKQERTNDSVPKKTCSDSHRRNDRGPQRLGFQISDDRFLGYLVCLNEGRSEAR